MYPKHYSIYSKIDKDRLDTLHNSKLKCIEVSKKEIIRLQGLEQDGLHFRYKRNNFDEFDFINHIPIDVFKQLFHNLFEIYKKLFPYGTLKTFIEEKFSTFIFECEGLIKILDSDNIIFWHGESEFCFYRYEKNDNTKVLVLKDKTENDLHFYKTYLTALLDFIKTEITTGDSINRETASEKLQTNFEDEIWFKVGIHFATGEIKKLSENGFSNPKIAEKLGNKKFEQIIKCTIGDYKKGTNKGKNIYNNPDRVRIIYDFCKEKNIPMIQCFVEKHNELPQD